jgi:hypothetical protein
MDFIVKLPPSKEPVTDVVYDSILVMVDRLTKYAHFIPYKESSTAEQLGHLVIDRLVRYHGIPTSLVTDRDKLFTSNYWKTLVARLERANQTLETYLRHYVNHAQDN